MSDPMLYLLQWDWRKPDPGLSEAAEVKGHLHRWLNCNLIFSLMIQSVALPRRQQIKSFNLLFGGVVTSL